MTAPQLSLCVGVTGHRDIAPDQLGRVTQLVNEAFDRLQKLGCPILVLSALAEGADRLVAQIALDRGHALVVPLPLAVEDYSTDFQTAESKAEFAHLLERAERHYVVEQLKPHKGEAQRDAAYRSVGVATAHACHVLMALWDGIDNHKSGGTANIVQTKLHGEHTTGMGRRGYDVRKPNGTVIQVVTPRASGGDQPTPALKWPDDSLPKTATPEEKEHHKDRVESWRRTLSMARRIRRFNSEAASIDRRAPEKVARSRSFLHGSTPPEPPGLGANERLVNLYALADALAIRGQWLVRLGWRLLMACGVLGVVAYGFYAHSQNLEDSKDLWFGRPRIIFALHLYVLILGVAFGAYILMTRLRTQPRFLDYRALAEGLRVHYFWRVAALPGEPADWYPSHLTREVYWLTMALRTEQIRLPAPVPTAQGLEFAKIHWVKGQRDYFTSANKRNHHLATLYKNVANILLLLGGLLPAAVIILIHTDSPWLTKEHHHIREFLVLGIAFLPALAGALATYTDKLGHETQSRQYERMLDLFKLAIQELEAHSKDEAAQRRTLVRLAGDALGEHAQWVVLHRQRPFEIRAGG